jgi:hypothetical protein
MPKTQKSPPEPKAGKTPVPTDFTVPNTEKAVMHSKDAHPKPPPKKP